MRRIRRLANRTTAALALALVAFLHYDPLSPWDPIEASDPTNISTPERRATMWREYEYMLADPWGTTDDATRAGVLKMMDRLRSRWPEEFGDR